MMHCDQNRDVIALFLAGSFGGKIEILIWREILAGDVINFGENY